MTVKSFGRPCRRFLLPYAGHVTDSPVDGRRARTERGKQAAVDALIEILMNNEPILGMGHIAERAGISERTMFRYFGNQDGMFKEVAAALLPVTTPYLLTPPPEGSLESRVRALAELRCDFARRFAAVGRTVDRFVSQFEMARDLRKNRDALIRKQFNEWFAPERKKLDRRTLVVVQEMMGFAFIDALNEEFGQKAPTVLADHVLLVMRSGLRRGRASGS